MKGLPKNFSKGRNKYWYYRLESVSVELSMHFYDMITAFRYLGYEVTKIKSKDECELTNCMDTYFLAPVSALGFFPLKRYFGFRMMHL